MSFVSAAYRIEAELAGDYATVVKADAPVGYWRLGDREGYAQAVLSDAPVGYWRMDAPSGTSETDRSAGGHNGTYSGGFTLNQSGALGDGDKAALFDGTTGFVSVPNAAALQIIGDLTLELWVNISLATRTTLLSKSAAAEFELTIETGGQVNFFNNSSVEDVISAPGALLAGVWQHLVVTRTAATKTINIYVNNALVKTGAYTVAVTSSANAINIGRSTAGIQFANGALDEVAIYNYALSAQQIANHYALRTSTIATVAAATVADSSGNGYTGTVSGGVTLQQATNQPDLDTAALFDGTSGYVSVFGAGCRITGALTVEAWVKLPSAPPGFSIVARCGATGDVIYALLITSALKLFYQHSPDGATFLNAASTATLATGVYQHVAVVRNAAGTSVSFYLNGAFVDTIALAAAPQPAAFQTTYLGGSFLLNQMLGGTLDEVAVYSYALTAAQLQAHYLAGFWTSLGLDVCKAPGPHWTRGNTSNGPLDHVAGTGTLEFAVRNDARNTGSTEGWYSPNHASCRPGWGYGIPVRLVSTYQSVALGDGAPVDRVLWRGKITTLLPDAGKYGPRQVHVTAQDCIGDLAQNDAIQIAPQLNQPEDALIQAVIAAMPAAAQPPAISLDAGVDVYPYTFDNIGGGVKALSAITDVVVSAYGWVYCLATGTLRYESRHTRALKTSSFTFTELTHDDVVVPSALDNVYNRVRVTIHPRTIDPAATTVLCGATGAVLVGAGQTVTVWDTYRDQTNTLKLIGGSGFVTPIVAITDYLGNTASDGSGSDVTASISVATTTFAASAKFDITNSGGVDAYVTRRQLRGKGIYDNAPVTFESYIPMSYGDRPLDIDLPYQTDVTIAQAFAAYIATLFSALTNQADAVSFNPQRSDAVMTQALIRDIGDLITESETMTGMTSALLQIVGVEGAIEPGQILQMRYVVGWAGTGNVFIFDDAVHGVFDSALSPLGYA